MSKVGAQTDAVTPIRGQEEVDHLRPRPFEYFPLQDTEKSIPALFERQVAAKAAEPAIRVGDNYLTYDSLNDLSNRIAHAILERIGPGEEQIALLLGRGSDAVAGIIGTLKACKCYVPIDPEYPPERISFVFEDSGCSLIVTNNNHFSLAMQLVADPFKVINIDRLDTLFPVTNPVLTLSPDSLAYIIYTSGSTGNPKGVTHSHRTVLFSIMNRINSYEISTGDRIANLGSPSYSVSCNEIFSSLLSGAMLVPFDLKKEGVHGLKEWLIREKITVLELNPPAIYRELIASLDGEEFSDLRTIKLSGDRVYRADIDHHFDLFPAKCLLRNGYGSSEMMGTHGIAFHNEGNTPGSGIAPVGYAFKGVETLIVDEDGGSVAAGEAGEIVIRSKYLSPGYWKRPDLTGSVFSPCSEEDGLRRFQTGDLGMMLSDGCLVHLGRKDFQVKVRGYRVELAEIEMKLLELPKIREACVIPLEDGAGEKYLAAYVVSAKPSPTVPELKETLRNSLPDFMIPSAIVLLDSLPLLPNGKIDRKSLPTPSRIRLDLDACPVAPRNSLEKELIRIWESILSVAPIGMKDSFFELGGTSIQALDLFAQIERTFKKSLPLSTLLENSTVEYLAEKLGERESVEDETTVVPLQPNGNNPPLYCVHGFDGHIFYYRELARLLAPDQPVFGLQGPDLNVKTFKYHSLEEIAAFHVEKILVHQAEGPFYLLGHSAGGILAFEIAQQLKSRGQAVGLLALVDSFLHPRKPLWQLVRPYFRLIMQLDSKERPGYLFDAIRKNVLRGARRLFLIAGRVFLGGKHPKVQKYLTVREYYVPIFARYTPSVYPEKITFFWASLDSLPHADERKSGWEQLAGGGFETHEVETDHDAIVRNPGDLVNLLKICLEKNPVD